MGRDVTIGVADVVGDAGGGDRVDAVRQWDEHRVGVWYGQLIGERPAPVTGAKAHAIHGDRRDSGATGGAPGTARRTNAAVDLKRDDHTIPGLDRAHQLADAENLGDAFVPEVQWQRELRGPEHERAVEVTRGGGDRMHDRAIRTGLGRSRNIAPAQASAGSGDQRTHPGAGAADSLTGAVTGGRGQPAQPLMVGAFQDDGRRRGGAWGEESRVVAHPPTRATSPGHMTSTISPSWSIPNTVREASIGSSTQPFDWGKP